VTLLDADQVRPLLCPDLGYSEEDRLKNMLRLAFVAKEVVRHGGLAIVAAVSPLERHRQVVREQFAPSSFLQVWVDTPLQECIRRDVKGMYRAALAGQIQQFTGIGAPYEPPLEPEVVCKTVDYTVDQCVNQIMSAIEHQQRQLGALA
jgi:sulfate adenylyltransferase